MPLATSGSVSDLCPASTPSFSLNREDTRILLTFLMDKGARPTPKDMKLWVDVLRFVKRGARGGALGFFTYMELSASSRPCASSPRLRACSDMVPPVPRPPPGQAEVVRASASSV